MKEVEKKTRSQIRKKRYKMATIDREKVVGKLAEKWKSGDITTKISEINKNKKKKRSKRKRMGMGWKWARKYDQEGKNFFE